LGTLPGKVVLFNFDGPDNVTSLRVPYKEVLRLEDYWLDPFDFGKVLVVNYTAAETEDVALIAAPIPSKLLIENTTKDVNSIKKHLAELATEEGPGNIVIETVGSFGMAIFDYLVATNGRAAVQVQDYIPVAKKFASLLGKCMSYGLNVVLTGHLQSDRDEVTQKGRLVPLVWGSSIREAVPRMFGECFQSLVTSDGKGGVKYQWLTKPDPNGFIGFLGTRKMDADKLPKFVDQDYSYLDKAAKEFDAAKVKGK
jgi:hypothetical protein